MYSPALLLLSPRVWNKLSDADKVVFVEAAKKAGTAQRKKVNEDESNGIAQLEKDGLTMGESDRRSKETELGRQTREFQRLQREFREDLNLRRNEELASLFERANKVIRQIAESEKFDLILQEAVYRSPRIDITEKVLKALSAEK